MYKFSHKHTHIYFIHQYMCLIIHLLQLTSGMIGVFVVVETACMFGQIRQLWNSRTAQMVGSDLFLTVNLRQCIQAEVPKMEMTVQVCINNSTILSKCLYSLIDLTIFPSLLCVFNSYLTQFCVINFDCRKESIV